MRKFVLTVGMCWAVAAWLLWPLTPHRGYETALGSAIWLAPSYILLSVYRGATIPIRVFVGCATGFLLLIGIRVIPGRYDPVLLYLVCPPVLALATALARHCLKTHDTGRPPIGNQ
jgi:hypothetical protein